MKDHSNDRMTGTGADDEISLVESARSGNAEAMSDLIKLIYGELKNRARWLMVRERPGHSFGPSGSELVQRTMEKVLATGGGIFSAARTEEDLLNMLTRQMRFVLVDYARAHNGGKRADPHARVSFEDVERTEPVTHLNIEQVLIVNEILEKLTIHDAAAAQAFELRFFAGLTNEEAAAAMGISLSAFRRHLKRADIFVRRIANPLPSGGEEEGSRA